MEFGAVQIVGGIIMIICSLLIIVITMMQEQKQQDMGAISGQSENFYGKGNVSSSREQALNRLTKILAVIFFVVTIAVNIIPEIVEKVSSSGS